MAVDLRISLRKLEILAAVVHMGGITRAGDNLYLTQPVVSAHIRSLEERLGVKLFYRQGREMHLTEAGILVHQWACELLRKTHELERDLTGLSEGSKGNIALGASMTIGSYRLPGELVAFRQTYPDVRVSLRIATTEEVIEETRASELDFAIVATEPDLEVPGMDIEQIGSDRIVLVTAAGAEPRDPVISVDHVAGLAFIETPEGIFRRSIVDRKFRAAGVSRRNVVLELGHAEAIKRAAIQGLGVAMLFRTAIGDELASGVLREVEVEGMDIVVPISVVSRTDAVWSGPQRALLEAIRLSFAAAAEDRLLTQK